MTTYIALLRAVNVGGTGKLPMSDLQAICESVGFQKVQTYIASGNVIFDSSSSAGKVKQSLETQLENYAGKKLNVAVRTATEMTAVLDSNPFPEKAGNRTVAIFLDVKPPRDSLKQATGLADEELRLGEREIYVHYGAGMAHSKLKIPAAKHGTARNMNTVAKLVELARRT